MTRRIAIIVEGATEKAFAKVLRDYLSRTLSGRMPKLKFITEDGRIPTRDRLKRDVQRLLEQYDEVIALTEVYTGPRPYEFIDAADAKPKMREWVGPEPRFHPHAAQYEFEAWLFPYWPKIQEVAGWNRNPPSSQPETVNHDKPPAKHLAELFLKGTKERKYSKTRDGAAICPELHAFLDTILELSANSS